MKEHMNISIKTERFAVLALAVCILVHTMALVIAIQAIALSERPVPVPITTVKINGKSYQGQIWGKDGVYAILNGDTMRFVAEAPGSQLIQTDSWMKLGKDEESSVKSIIIDDSISSLSPYALGTTQFKNLEFLRAEGYLERVGEYSLSFIPEDSLIEFNGVDAFGINALHDHNPDTITGAEPGEDALHYYPFK